jgi:hypothetical protein
LVPLRERRPRLSALRKVDIPNAPNASRNVPVLQAFLEDRPSNVREKLVKPRVGNYTELTVERRGQKALRGTMWIEAATVVVESEDGRHKSKAITGEPPEETAKQILVDLDQERRPAGH